MFKEENRIWWYIIGLVFLFIIFALFARDFLIPLIRTGAESVKPDDYVYDSAPATVVEGDKVYRVNFFTSKGVVIADVYPQVAPENVNNFVFLAQQGYYDGTYFHRVFSDFLIQGGDRNTLNGDRSDDGLGTPGYLIDDEINWDALDLSETKREQLAAEGYQSVSGIESMPLQKNSLAMANAGPNTNAGQFFMVIADRTDPRLEVLNGRFTVIGEVISGGDVIAAISRVEVDSSDSNIPNPVESVILERVEVSEKS